MCAWPFAPRRNKTAVGWAAFSAMPCRTLRCAMLPAATLPARRASIAESSLAQGDDKVSRIKKSAIKIPARDKDSFPRSRSARQRNKSCEQVRNFLRRSAKIRAKRTKKSATPRGCAEVPPKEEVLEDMRRHLKRCPTRRHYLPKPAPMQALSAALQYQFQKI